MKGCHMLLKKNINDYCISETANLTDALTIIDKNKIGLLFVVNDDGRLVGSLSDGDVRRWIMRCADRILSNETVKYIVNHNVRFCYASTVNRDAPSLFLQGMKAVPVINSRHQIVSIALAQNSPLRFADRLISDDEPSFIIAEIGNNHNGCVKRAKDLVDFAISAGVDAVKFQMRSLDELYCSSQQFESCDLGLQYTLDLLSRTQLSVEEFAEIFDYCRVKGVLPLCTPWDLTSFNELEALDITGYKIASADLTNQPLLEAVAKTGKPIICSTGMSDEDEIIRAIAFLKQKSANFAMLHCNSTYPAPYGDINLNYMKRLAELSERVVGYSGHEHGYNVAVAAVAVGAKIIEKHFTLDRSLEGNDHKVSLLPDELSEMVKAIRQVESSMGTAGSRSISQGEMMNREVLSKSLIITRDLCIGEVLQRENVAISSPGIGIQPDKLENFIGFPLAVAKTKGSFLFQSDFQPQQTHFSLRSLSGSWGVPARYHDINQIISDMAPPLIEVHLSYHDLDVKIDDYLKTDYQQQLVIHAPELFIGDHTLDLCSEDEDYRRKSISYLQHVINKSEEIYSYFAMSHERQLIVNVGGFTEYSHLSVAERQPYYRRLKDSLQQLDKKTIEILPQTMPPFPWHFGGQRFHNIMMDEQEIIEFCTEMNMRICLDVSHTKLASQFLQHDFCGTLRALAPFTAHMHLADAKGLHGEGLQVSEGEIDWNAFMMLRSTELAHASFIVEIWQGHKNANHGAKTALYRLQDAANNYQKTTKGKVIPLRTESNQVAQNHFPSKMQK